MLSCFRLFLARTFFLLVYGLVLALVLAMASTGRTRAVQLRESLGSLALKAGVEESPDHLLYAETIG